jgi:hypothetical protein
MTHAMFLNKRAQFRHQQRWLTGRRRSVSAQPPDQDRRSQLAFRRRQRVAFKREQMPCREWQPVEVVIKRQERTCNEAFDLWRVRQNAVEFGKCV